MICGGSLQVEFRYLSREMDGFEEVFEELRKEAQKERKAGKVYIFGGGHVRQALAQVLVFLGFSCVILEDREEFLKKELFPGEVQLRRIDNQRIGESVSIREEDCVCIMTRGHKDDPCHRSTGAADKGFLYRGDRQPQESGSCGGEA